MKESSVSNESWISVASSSSPSQVQYKKKVHKESSHTNPFALLGEKDSGECDETDTNREVPRNIPQKAPTDRMERRKWEAAKRQASFIW